MTKPKFKIGQKVRRSGEEEVYVIGKILDCRERFNDSFHDWAYGEKGETDERCTFEKFLSAVTPLEELL